MMGKVYNRGQKSAARTERKRRRNLGTEWDGFHGRGQRAQQYWWDLPDRKKSAKGQSKWMRRGQMFGKGGSKKRAKKPWKIF